MLNLILFAALTGFWVVYAIVKVGRRRSGVADLRTHAAAHLPLTVAADNLASIDVGVADSWTALDDRQLDRLLRESAP